MRYCLNCQQLVDPQKTFNGILFIILLCCTCIGGIIYLIYYAAQTKKCPMCGSTNWGVMPSESTKTSISTAAAPVAAPATASKFCPNCGSPIKGDEKYCSSCGLEI